MRQLLTVILIASLISGCGIKRTLELPQDSKHKEAVQQPPAATNADTVPAQPGEAVPQK